MSPVVHGVDDEGRVAISSREPAYKVRNLRRDPRASLIGLNDGFFGRWVQVDGTVELISLPEAMEPLVELCTARSRASTRTGTTTGPPWCASSGLIVALTPTSAGPSRAG